MQDHEHVTIPNEGPFDCKKCNKDDAIFETRIDYLKHLLLCYYPDIYTCTTCSNSYANYYQFLFHIRYIHAQLVYMCAICTRKYKSVKDLLYHDQLMHSKNVNYCEICFEAHKSRKDLYEHYKRVHLNEDISNDIPKSSEETSVSNKFSSESQGGEFSIKKTKKNSDIQATKNANDNSLDSSSQNKTVQKKDLVRGLMDRKHQCKWCATRFFTKSQLKQHEATHVNASLVCPVCDKEFTHKDRLAGHMKCHMEPW